ncbi:MAG TPA: GFA family protein [Polyangiaceae bacterium]
MTTRYEGGCHCEAVRFRVDVEDHLAFDCNCSMCATMAYLHVIVPPERFAILAGMEAITVYTFNTGVAKHMFCRVCGVHPFYRPRSHPNDWDVNARCLDDGAASRFRVEPFDGRNWEANFAGLKDRHS